MTLTAINPANGDTIQTYEQTPFDKVKDYIEGAHRAFTGWKETSFSQRAELMKNASKTLIENKEAYAKIMAMEMGKPIRQGRAEVEKCAWVCDYYADNASGMLQPEKIVTDASNSSVSFRPLGVVLAIMPWNYPFWQVFRFAAPGLMAGNAAVLKHASNVPGCAMAIEDVFSKAGFPENLFRNLLISGEQTKGVIEHPLIKAVTLTGSNFAGQAVASTAGKMLKKSVLELGGSDPYIVLEDADLESAAKTCVESRLLNSGQSCIAAKRFVVIEDVRQRFEDLFTAYMQAKKMGNPMEEDIDVGPQARFDLRDDLHRQVAQSMEKGAKCLLGGEIPNGKGAYYPATVLSGVQKGMPAYEEEVFGPVAAIISVKDEREAIQVANDTSFGLGAAIFTEDLERGERIATYELEAGCCFVNAFVKSDPRLPFGGIKASGYGRELSHYGIKEFVNIKTIYVK
ncbi:MAG: NAD-dependent succinate-semialdehyde dehydrogenase [Desulfobacterales bacterium]|nr:NAD-dependent succinate-semialdehyde dehydrogenase [Desulfobacterales bacterium]